MQGDTMSEQDRLTAQLKRAEARANEEAKAAQEAAAERELFSFQNIFFADINTGHILWTSSVIIGAHD